MRNHIFLTLTFATVLFKGALSQRNTDFQLGVIFNYNHSNISLLSETIIPEKFFTNYNIIGDDEEKFNKGYSAGLSFGLRAPEDSRFLFQAEALYSYQPGKFIFNNYEKDFNYEMGFDLNYLNFNLLCKFHPGYELDMRSEVPNKGGWNFGGGVQYGIILNPDEIINYKSWGAGVLPSFGTPELQEEQLNMVLKGKNNFALVGLIEYELQTNKMFKPFLGLRVNYGLSDVVDVISSQYNFDDSQKNKNLYFQLTFGCSFFESRVGSN